MSDRGFPEDVMDRIARARGWLPLDPGARMEVGLDGKRWVVQRVAQGKSALSDKDEPDEPDESASSRQVGGSHYKDMAIQPVEYIHRNGLGFIEGSVVKYVSRWRSKGGVEDLHKAIHFLQMLIDLHETSK